MMGRQRDTYNVPTLNIKNTPIFFLRESWSLQIWGRGSDSATKSSRMLIDACAYESELLFSHFPACSPSHPFHAWLTGEQRNMQARTKAIMEARLKAITEYVIRRNFSSGKIFK